MKKGLLWISILFAIAILTTGCSSASSSGNTKGQANDDKEKGKLTIGYNPFAETIAEVNIWKQILEDKGYQVELKQTEKGPLFASLSEGDVDIDLEVWLPTTDKPYVDKYKDGIVKHKSWYKDTTLGLVVPSYMDIDSIEDLNNHKDDFNGQIIGIDPGASIMKNTEKAIDAYDLDFDLVESSDSAMSAALKKNYDEKKPIVTTLWEPHWAFSRWDLKFLDDPKNVYGDPDEMYWYSREKFADDFPEVTKWLDQWDMSHEQLSGLMNVMKKYDKKPEKGAKKWLEDNQDLVEEWTKS